MWKNTRDSVIYKDLKSVMKKVNKVLLKVVVIQYLMIDSKICKNQDGEPAELTHESPIKYNLSG